VAALRERSGDIAEIAEAILLRLARRTNSAPPELSEDAVQALQTYPFPATCASSRTYWNGH